jgi:Transposase DDE domain group 1
VKPVSRGIDRIAVTFDEDNLVANAGLLLVATVVNRLGLEALVNALVRIPSRRGGFQPGRKVLTLVHAMVAGASHIDHADVLRAGASDQVLAHRVMAPSTLGTFLRGFTFGHLRQLDAVCAEVLRRAWALMELPERVVVDLDSTICEVSGKLKAGAAFGYTKVLGYHPLLATRVDTGEVLHVRMRKGSANTQRGAKRFVEELIARLRRAGASGQIVLRMDSGFWSKETMTTLARLGVSYTMAVRTGNNAISQAIAVIPDDDWVRIDYPDDGEAQVAETTYDRQRLVVRRTRLVGAQATLWPAWRHFAFLTDLAGTAVEPRRLPPWPRHRRARHPGPQRRGGPRALPLGELLGQRRLAGLRRARPQPHSLDTDPRRDPRRRRHATSGTGPHAAHALRLDACSSRQPFGDTHAARTNTLAVARVVRPRPRHRAGALLRADLTRPPRSARPQTTSLTR